MSRDHRLASYGTLAPGRENHDQVAGLRGAWRSGSVRGSVTKTGWGVAVGYPVLTLAADGAEVAVALFDSPDLPDHWPRLDAFEGDDYRRVATLVATADGAVEAWIYVAAG